jgi:hypothetical protein
VYKINLYPAGLEQRASRAASVRSALLFAFLGGANLLVLGFFLMVALSVGNQAATVESRVGSLQARMTQHVDAPTRSLSNQARLLLERRAQRVTWTPALDEVRSMLPAELIVERLEATSTTSLDVFSGMQISGRLRSGRNVDPVVEFMNRLSAAPAYRRQFQPSKLERVDNSRDVSRFVVACPLARPAEFDSTAEGSAG